MTKHPPHQRQVTQDVDVWEHGEYTSIAAWEDCDPGLVSSQYSPDRPDRPAIEFRYLKRIWAGGHVDVEKARRVHSYVDSVVRSMLWAAEVRKESVDTLICAINERAVRSLREKVEQLPFSERLETIRAMKKDLDDLERCYVGLDCENSPDEQTKREQTRGFQRIEKIS